MSEATRLIEAVSAGDAGAAESLLPVVYEELRRLARSQMVNERAGHTLQATALVHEAYLRLVDQKDAQWDGRRHFFAAAAEAMRRILVDHARQKTSLKRGGAHERVELNDEIAAIKPPCESVEELLALDDALARLERENAGMAQLVKVSFFAGLSLDEAARRWGSPAPPRIDTGRSRGRGCMTRSAAAKRNETIRCAISHE